MTERKDAAEATKAMNDKLLRVLPFEDRRDFEDAERGFIAPLPDGGVIRGEDANDVWNMSKFSFIEESSPVPDTVNPSLWRQSQLVLKGGLFKVTDRLYQVRNADLSNLTIVEGDTGLIVFDPLITTETAHWTLELYFAHRPRKPVVAASIRTATSTTSAA
jgi:alkyl sulfatase BDS1-like metallo-beta-lactamase superfamily hydrolase